MNDNGKRNNRNESEVISWIITAVFLWLWFPLGILFLISKLGKNDFLKRAVSKFLDKASNKGNININFDNKYKNQQWSAKWNNQYTNNAGAYNPSEGREAGQSGEAKAAPKWEAASTARPATWEAKPQKESPVWGTGPRQDTAVKQGPAAAPTQAASAKAGSSQSQKKTQTKSKINVGKIDRVTKGRGALLFFGWVLFAIGALSAFGPLFAGEFWDMLQYAAVAVGGGAMLIAAAGKTKKEKEYDKYLKIVGSKPCIEIEKLASAMGSKIKEVYREVEDMVERGYFGKSAFVNKAEGLLIIDPEEAEAAIIKNAPPPPEEPKDKYDMLLTELCHACERLENQEMINKAEKIRSLTEQIFDYVRETPEKESSISSFINYYLPTTLKLINSYADFEAQEFQGQNILKSRERIETAMDTIIQAYERQLDNLFLIDTIDVTSDINVLENMMKRDGLSGGSDFGTTMNSN
jgi:hypothetical protein